MPRIVEFLISEAGIILPLPFILFVCDMLVTMFLRVAFGTIDGFFLPRSSFWDSDAHKRMSVSELIEKSKEVH